MNIDTIRRLHQQAAFQAGAIKGRQLRQEVAGLRAIFEMRVRQQEEATRQAFLQQKHGDISPSQASALEELESEYKKHGIRIITEG